MPDNVSGNYSLPSGYLAAAGDPILVSNHNPPLEDIATALSARLSADGRKVMTGALTLSGDATAALHAVPKQQLDAAVASLSAAMWSAPLVKLSDTTITSNITPASDATLTFAMAANTNYRIRGELFVFSSALGGFRAGITGPASPTNVRLGSVWANDISNTVGGFNITSYAQFHNALPAGSTNMHFTITCDLQNGANAGTFALQFAQNTSHASGCAIRKGSYIDYRTY